VGNIRDKPLEFYRGFHVVVCGLDSVEARLWLNETLVYVI
jgi:ubiquitin-activating enzyme E1 C